MPKAELTVLRYFAPVNNGMDPLLRELIAAQLALRPILDTHKLARHARRMASAKSPDARAVARSLANLLRSHQQELERAARRLDAAAS